MRHRDGSNNRTLTNAHDCFAALDQRGPSTVIKAASSSNRHASHGGRASSYTGQSDLRTTVTMATDAGLGKNDSRHARCFSN
jgi:hypothetical protein